MKSTVCVIDMCVVRAECLLLQVLTETRYTYVVLPDVSFLVPTDNGPSTHGVPRERLSAAMLPQVPPMDYDIIFPKDELDKANKDKKRYPSNFKVSSNVLLS